MKKLFTENSFINLNHRERRAVFLLISLLLLSILVYCLTLWWPRKQIYDVTTLQDIVIDSDFEQRSNSNFNPGPSESIISLYSFDPNLITKSELEKFGLSSKVASIWTNYTLKGGRFKKHSDLKKIYGLKPVDFERLKPYIKLETTTSELKEVEALRPIDLNVATYKDLIKIGMPLHIANTLIKFRTSGKTFRTISDLKKVIGMNDSLAEMLTPFILFPQTAEESLPADSISGKSHLSATSVPINNLRINLNQADTIELKYLPGIGSKLALRIMKYRENLGGFYSPDQLREVYGITDSTISKFRHRLMVEGDLRRINVNTTDLTKIYHPYIDKKQATVIQNYIRQHQPIQSIEDLRKIEVLDQLFWNKLEPYLEFSRR